MQKRTCWRLGLVAAILFSATATWLSADAVAKKKVTSETDLPRFSYPAKGTASALLQADDATFQAFAVKVRTDVDSVLRDYDIEDKSTLRALLRAKADLQELVGDDAGAVETLKRVRSLQEKPSSKLLSGMVDQAIHESILETKAQSGPALEQSFRQHLQAMVSPLPWTVVQREIKSNYAFTRVFAKNNLIAEVETEIDPSVKKSGALDAQEAWALIQDRNDLKYYIPLEAVTSEVLQKYIAAHSVMKPDIWAAREVTLTADQKLKPVLVAIWDSGIDVSLFPNQLFTDPHPTASGAHGLAFDDAGAPSPLWLYPLTDAQKKDYPIFREDSVGFQDIEDGIDSSAAQKTEARSKTLSIEQSHQLDEAKQKLGFYAHGTHCAGIAVRGNAAARLVVARFDDELPDFKFPPTEAWVKHIGTDFMEISNYFKTRHVRVVNMSWSDDPEEFELWLSKTGGGADPAACKKQAAQLYALWRQAIEAALKNAPDTLFVCAAGNSNGNAGFNADVPASLHLPNLLTVGAVNQAGDETSFTSYGDTVVVDADGFEVESFVPGGARLKFSGTSMATPNVVNLAAKLFALDSSLTPEAAIKLIREGATTSEDGRRHLIDEKKSVALLDQQKK